MLKVCTDQCDNSQLELWKEFPKFHIKMNIHNLNAFHYFHDFHRFLDSKRVEIILLVAGCANITNAYVPYL